MEPRSDERGNALYWVEQLDDYELQWCRALTSAEIDLIGEFTVPAGVLQWSRALTSAEMAAVLAASPSS